MLSRRQQDDMSRCAWRTTAKKQLERKKSCAGDAGAEGRAGRWSGSKAQVLERTGSERCDGSCRPRMRKAATTLLLRLQVQGRALGKQDDIPSALQWAKCRWLGLVIGSWQTRRGETNLKFISRRQSPPTAAIGSANEEPAAKTGRRPKTTSGWHFGTRHGGHMASGALLATISRLVLSWRWRSERKNLPRDWAATQNNLGCVRCGEQSEPHGRGTAGAALLAQAVAAYRLALEVQTKKTCRKTGHDTK